jgi:hydrogenase-4 component B
MPRTGLLFLTGAVAICGLPPLNGFVSEFLVYLGLFGTLNGAGARFAAFAAPLLALVGGLAVSCFVKAFGAVFLGEPRTADGAGAHDAPLLTGPMTVLAACCALIGLAPFAPAPLLQRAAAAVAGPDAPPLPLLRHSAPLGMLAFLHVALAIALIACQQGLATTGGAEGVGRRTTSSVVVTLFVLILIDALFTVLFRTVGL